MPLLYFLKERPILHYKIIYIFFEILVFLSNFSYYFYVLLLNVRKIKCLFFFI